MKAVTWQGPRDVRVFDVPDPVVSEPTDAIVRITSTAICGSDLRLYEVVDGRGPDAVVDAVGMEAHGSPRGSLAQKAAGLPPDAGLLPDAVARPVIDKYGSTGWPHCTPP